MMTITLRSLSFLTRSAKESAFLLAGNKQHLASLLAAAALLLLPATTGMGHDAAQWEPESVTMTIVQSGGEATLEWVAKPGYLYTLMYAPSRRAGVEWRPHPQYTRIRGEGQRVVAVDRVPVGVQRHYRLHLDPDPSYHRRR